MGRKSAIDLAGLSKRILKMANEENLTIKQIADILQSEGLVVSSSSIQRKIKSAREAASDFMKAVEESEVLIGAVRSNPNTDVVEVTTTLLARRIFEYVRDVEKIDFDDPAALTSSLAKLATAQTHVSRLRLNYQKGFEDAKKAILTALKDGLKTHPEIFEKLTFIVNELKSKEKS